MASSNPQAGPRVLLQVKKVRDKLGVRDPALPIIYILV